MRDREALRNNKTMLLLAVFAAVLVAVNLLLPDSRRLDTALPEPSAASEPAAALPAEVDREKNLDKIVISEIMIKNHAALRDDDGDFSDWVELYNCCGESVSLAGWSLSDREGRSGTSFPDIVLFPGERLLVYASGKGDMSRLHTGFAVSAGESVYLYDDQGVPVCAVPCEETLTDASISLCADGEYRQSLYPTPGEENSAAGYDAVQSRLSAAGPLIISEVAVAGVDSWVGDNSLDCDWVEIKNASDGTVLLSDYYLSDDLDDPFAWRLPQMSLAPGEMLVVCCGSEQFENGYYWADFGLDSVSDELFLSSGDALVDYASLRDIPYGCTFGRAAGSNGWFYFAQPTPGWENGAGYRRVSATPASLGEDGVFDGAESVAVELSGSGRIYYTTDGSLPTESSIPYDGAFTVSSTCIVRAIAVEEGAMPSRPLTLSYFINEGHSLPVLSLVSDNTAEFDSMYSYGRKGYETPGSLSLYEEGGSFTIPCGIKMHGESSLILDKKNMSIRFRGSYGQETLNYDVFGGGVTEFTNLLLRAGQDQYSSIIRNELCENLALAADSAAISTRSKYCVLYIDGRYKGIYALSEKTNEQLYASLAGVSRDSVRTVEGDVWTNDELYTQVFAFCYNNDMSLPENYEHFCSLMDVDSLIDWAILEGFFANDDLTSGNVRYCRSAENDGKWRLMFYDLDAALHNEASNFYNILSYYSISYRQVPSLLGRLMNNADFRDSFLKRAAELLNGPLSNESVLNEIDRLAAQIQPEAARNLSRIGRSEGQWLADIEYLRSFIAAGDWVQHNIDTLCSIFDLDADEREAYFGGK